MAPKKKRATGPAPPSDEALVARMSRPNLETVVLSLLRDARARGDDVAELLSSALPSAPKPVVGRDVQREGTGCFDDLDDELLACIMGMLPLPQRLSCATCTCKSWRFLRDREELWTSLELRESDVVDSEGPSIFLEDDNPAVAAGLSGYLYISGGRLEALARWLPSGGKQVRSLAFYGGKGASVKAGQIQGLLQALPSLTSITLSGKEIKKSVFTCISKLPSVGNLASLCFAEPIHGNADGLLSILAKAPRLETLCAPSKFLEAAHLRQAHDSWTAARGGGAPLLSTLRVNGLHISSNTLLSALPALARMFPELDSLEFAMNSYGVDWDSQSSLPDLGAHASFGRLRTLKLTSGMLYDTGLTTEQLGNVLRACLKGCPVLEKLTVHFGNSWSRMHASKMPLLADGTMAHLPSTISHLELSDIRVRPTDLSGFDIDLPRLERLVLHNCGDDAKGLCLVAASDFKSLRHLTVTDWAGGRKPKPRERN